MAKVKIRMTADAQGMTAGEELEVDELRAARWCDQGRPIAERVSDPRLAPGRKRAAKAATADEE